FVFQFFHLLPTLTAAENVALPLLFDGSRRGAAVEAASRLLERVGLAGKQRALPGELSGGEMQRVAIARALVTDPRLILADEPTGNLDSHNGAAILDLLTSCVRETGAALLMVTHDLEASRRADQIITLKDGRLT
ncbi:MAG TPA: ATP-binding cassette domain-containing protein, partial [Acidimicrobiales bacterium]|nr:ATP-binding cassette domain-containing protein [Acidimicrobiales bacterium]